MDEGKEIGWQRRQQQQQSHTQKNVLIPKRSETKQNSITYLLCDIQYTNRQMSWLLKMVANKRTNELNVHSSWLQLVQHNTPAR